MAKRKNTPDLMSEVLGSTDGQTSESLKPRRSQNLSIASEALREYLDGGKTQATLYLADDIHESLEDAVTKMRRNLVRMVPDGKQKRTLVTRSLLVNFAVKEMLDDLEANGIEGKWGKLISGL